jgi:hypothetical protein
MSLLAALACAALGCGGGTAGPGDGGPDGGDARGDVLDDPDGGESDAPPDVAGPEVERFGVPLPTDVAPPVRLLNAGATLSGEGRTSCSHQEPASGNGDRWCAFRTTRATGGTELWVMNVSAAARGTVPVCDGKDPACLRLTSTLWPSYGNDFDGDTLIFYSDPPAGLMPGQPFVGPVSAWRPGWKAPHVLASQASVCTAHRGAAVALCFDEPRGNPDNPDDVRLRVGVLTDSPDELPSLPGRWPFKNDGSIPWQVGFSPDGETFAVSVPDVMPFVQNLSIIPTREVGTGDLRRNVLSDVKPWTISNDGAKILFYRGPRTDATLAMADFPSGMNETVLATKIVEFLLLGRGPADTALLLRVRNDGGGHAFQILRDRAHPETALTVFTNEGTLEGLAVSADLRYTAWIDPDFRGSVIRHSDLMTCAMNPAPGPEVSAVGFLDDSSYVFWQQPADMMHSRRDGYLATPDGCGEHTRYASGIGFVAPIGTRGLVYGDEHSENDRTVTLKYAGLADGLTEATAGGVRVQERVTSPVTLVSGVTGAGSLHAIYGAHAPDGVFMFAVPF